MNNKNKYDDLDFVFGFSSILEKDQINYIYRGIFSQSIIVDILSLTEKNIVQASDHSKIKKKVYNLMVECLQNITKHQANFETTTVEQDGIFSIQNKGDRYYITTGNLIRNENINKLKSKIELVNQMTKDDLKNQYREQLREGKISDKGGAGLGFIDMARKSGNKLFFDFKTIDYEHSFFYFRLQISTDPSEPEIKDIAQGASLDHIAEIHKMLINNNIKLVYNNVFNEEKQNNLLSYLQSHLAKSVLTRDEIYNVMVEMMTNIIKHGAIDKKTGTGKDAIFFICERQQEFQLFSGNYINNEAIENFRAKLETINELDYFELNSLFRQRQNKEKNIGTGMIEMRLKSVRDWNFKFYPFDQNYSYFTLQITVNKD